MLRFFELMNYVIARFVYIKAKSIFERVRSI